MIDGNDAVFALILAASLAAGFWLALNVWAVRVPPKAPVAGPHEDPVERTAKRTAVDLYRVFRAARDRENPGEAVLEHIRFLDYDASKWLAQGVAYHGTLTKLVVAAGFEATPDEIKVAQQFLAVMSAARVFDIDLYDQTRYAVMARGGENGA